MPCPVGWVRWKNCSKSGPGASWAITPPLGLLDVNHFYSKLSHFLDHLVEEGFVRAQHREMLQRSDQPQSLISLLEAWQPPAHSRWAKTAPQ